VILVPEPRNRHDRNAVAVHLDAVRVAHLARREAARYQQHIIEPQHSGRQVPIDAKLYGSAGSPDVGVLLELPDPGEMRRAFNEVRH
jgi:hypothetical protein